ncbi:MAG: hypothetical protein HXX20_13320 [Chloroflexi bacterium]|nr:hypothetical protein [Chloroflexota bacterium]
MTLKDSYSPLEVDLHYKVIPEGGLIERWAVVRNLGQVHLDIRGRIDSD